MSTIEKFVSVAQAEPNSEQVNISVLFQAQLDDGQFIVVLDDRGWSTSGEWTRVTPDEIRETSLVVVGPDEPAPGRTPAEQQHDYWQYIRSLLGAQQIHLPVDELMNLEHEVRFGPRLQRLLTTAGH